MDTGIAEKKLNITQIFLILYLAVTWVSALLSDYFPLTIIGASRYEGVITITFYVLICLLVSKYGSADHILLLVFAASTTIFDVICLLQLQDYNPFNLFPDGLRYSGADIDYAGAYIGTIGNVDLVGSFFSIAIPIFIVSLIVLKHRTKFLLFIPTVLSLVVLFEIEVYAGIIGLSGLVFSSVYIFEFSKKKRIVLLSAMVGVIVITLIILYFLTPENILLYQIHEILRGNIREEFGTYRVLIWEKVINLIPDSPIWGHGPDTMMFGDFGEYGEYDEASGIYISYIDAAHNEYLNVLYHQGTMGLIAFIGIIVSVVVAFIKNRGRNVKKAILGTAIICYSIQAMFGISMCISSVYFWMCIGLFVSENKKERENDI